VTRFDADTDADRIELVADAIAAHRERDSAFCTLEAQFADGTLNLDCTDDELDRLATLVSRFGAFTIEERETVPAESAEEDPGTNVRIDARADDERVGQFVDAVFQEVYDLPAEFRLWAVEV